MFDILRVVRPPINVSLGTCFFRLNTCNKCITFPLDYLFKKWHYYIKLPLQNKFNSFFKTVKLPKKSIKFITPQVSKLFQGHPSSIPKQKMSSLIIFPNICLFATTWGTQCKLGLAQIQNDIMLVLPPE